MLYTTKNVIISIFEQLADKLKEFDYDIRWFATGDIATRFDEYVEAKGVVTLINAMPSDPAFIIRLKDGSPKEHEIPVPVLTVSVGPRKHITRLGIGDSDSEWERTVVIAGFANDELEQMAFVDLFDSWLGGERTYLSVWDYEADEDSPSALQSVFVNFSNSTRDEIPHEVAAIRYVVRTEFGIRYADF